MSNILVELLGIIAGTLGVIAWVPQLNEVWKQKKHEGISLPTLYSVSYTHLTLPTICSV